MSVASIDRPSAQALTAATCSFSRCDALASPALGDGEGADDFRMVAAKSADQEQPRDRRRAEGEGRIVRQRLLQRADRVAGQAPVVRDRAIVRPGRRVRPRERQAQLILRH